MKTNKPRQFNKTRYFSKARHSAYGLHRFSDTTLSDDVVESTYRVGGDLHSKNIYLVQKIINTLFVTLKDTLTLSVS